MAFPENPTPEADAGLTADLSRLVRQERLWVPLLTHLDENGKIDSGRTAAQVRALRPSLSGFLLGGSTGAGWKLNDLQFEQLLGLARSSHVFDADSLLLIGCLRPGTGEVIARAQAAEQALSNGQCAGRFVGLTVCPPVGPGSQGDILEHFEKVLAATTFPIAIYQLPQVTRCELHPETMRTLVSTGRVHMFKDTSGADRVADSGAVDERRVWMLRGAEGGYFEALKPAGRYDGWLLSTANGLAMHYRRIERLAAAGDATAARQLSHRVAAVVEQVFGLAERMQLGNIFSNVNRAFDHVQAFGDDCLDAPMPWRIDGTTVPGEFIAQVQLIMQVEGLAAEEPYLDIPASDA